jgi:hypothetical protein
MKFRWQGWSGVACPADWPGQIEARTGSIFTINPSGPTVSLAKTMPHFLI